MKKTVALCAVFAAANYAAAATATLDSKDTGANHYYRPAEVGTHNWNDADATFNLEVVDDGWGGTSWAGFTYSDVNDTNTAGYSNQFAVYGDGRDYSDSGVYGIGYIDSFNMINPTVSFASAVTVNGCFVNNTTYAALDMLYGSGFSKKFGGATGADEDWFKLSIEGFDTGNSSQGSVDFYLADFRSADSGEDYILADWVWVDLDSLGSDVRSLKFSLSSSDNGEWGMNTPAYFAIDNLQTVPEPASVLLFVLGSLSIVMARRSKSTVQD